MPIAFENARKTHYSESCEAKPFGESTFRPSFLIYDGAIGGGTLLHAEQPSAGAPEFEIPAEAMHAAVDLAVAWMDQRLAG
ncbi:hypothetical protein ACG04R_23250 [Roseateles sp. BYS78W]|uniref:Uncharacterized protein n=1 Tax=Pelomonas candidula TaxID=3299025 RepID=A0ABW7HIF1_9BURK